MAKEGDTEYRRQEFDSAIENYKKAIHYSPDYTIAYFKLARTYYKMNDYENTRIIIDQNLAIDPKQEQSEKMLGDIYRKTGDNKKAMDHYNSAIAINENYSTACKKSSYFDTFFESDNGKIIIFCNMCYKI